MLINLDYVWFLKSSKISKKYFKKNDFIMFSLIMKNIKEN